MLITIKSRVIIACLFTLAWSATLLAQREAVATAPAPESLLATLRVLQPNTLEFEPLTYSEAWILTVSGPSNHDYRETFLAGDPIIVVLGEDRHLPDGEYSYELETAMTAIAGGDSSPAASSKKFVQSGRFLVSDGYINLAAVGESTWEMVVGDAGFGGVQFIDSVTGHGVLRLADGAQANSIVVDSSGEVGIGTSAPSDTLHLRRTDGTAKILVEEASAVTASRSLAELRNNGAAFFYLRNANLNKVWSFSVSGNGNFQVDDPMVAGGAEMVLTSSGTARIGPGGAQNFLLDPFGNLTIAGTLAELSDRGAKTDFEPVDPRQTLEKLVRLPVSAWRFKTDAEGIRHLGPTAQDFHGMFGLGADERHITPIDTSGVALVAIQGLHGQHDADIARLEEGLRKAQAQIAQKDAQLGRQRQDIEDLRARLAAVEKVLTLDPQRRVRNDLGLRPYAPDPPPHAGAPPSP